MRGRLTFTTTATLCVMLGCAADRGDSDTTHPTTSRQRLTGEFGQTVGNLGGGPYSASARPSTSRYLTATEHAAWMALKPAPLPARAPTPSATDAVLAKAAASPPASPISIAVQLAEPGFDFTRFQGVDDSGRSSLVGERQTQIGAAQSALEAQLLGIGATNLTKFWLVNQIIATVRAADVATIARWSNVVGLSENSHVSGPSAAYTGVETRIGTLLASFASDSKTGSLGNRTTGTQPVRLGIIEADSAGGSNWIARDHVGFKDSGGTNRVKIVYDCTSGTNCTEVTNTATGQNHATQVAWVAAGSIEAGQDTTYPGTATTDQITRSGCASGTWIYSYKVSGCGGVALALQRATADAVDVANMSFYTNGSGTCSPADCTGINDALKAATDAGVMLVGAAGNNNGASATTCNIDYPHTRSEILAVNGLDTSSAATAYQSTAIDPAASAMGGVPITTSTGIVYTVAGIAIDAPARYASAAFYTTGPANYGSSWVPPFELGGTSFAAPVVSGTAAMLKQVFWLNSWTTTDARALRVNLLTLVDGYSPLGAMTSHNSNLSGGGRLRAHYPLGSNLTAPWDWGWRAFTINDRQEVRWTVGDGTPRSASITQWKWALMWDEPNFNSIGDVDIRVVNTCPAGGGPEVVIAYQTDYDFRNRIRLNQADISGKCLTMVAYGYNVPVGGRVVYSADFFHSGTAD